MTEKVAVSVDKDFIRVGSKAYAIKQINSVDVTYHNPYSKGAPLACGLIATIALLSAIGGGGSGVFMLAVIFAGLAWWTHRRSKITEYKLVLATSSGSVQAVTSNERDFILNIRTQIERAIAGTLA